jgi:DNA polymerase
MAEAYRQLLDATIQHLEMLQARGVRHVMAQPRTLADLAAPVPVPVRSAPAAPRPGVAPAPSRVAAPTPERAVIPTAHASPAVIPQPVMPVMRDGPPLEGEAKAAAFASLRARALECVRCPHLAASRKHVVFGVGSLEARLMFVGEAPGADEDERGEPFVGRAGELLTKMIQAMGLSRDLVYIANILKCRPDTPGQPSGNRKPVPAEMQTCIPFLQEQIELIRPQALIALGATAVEGLLGHPVQITKLRGQWQSYRNIPMMPTYHPAYVLRQQNMGSNQGNQIKRAVWEDLLAAMEKTGLPISEKQRQFFLKA